ncbi:MBL fold metallo-hydrolase [Aequorivita lipolytica]|uniref:MBL fold metallo-hydrolase n=1 Tax=Aequorivita lipolytica TaxID=153267 RepID=A0A5C6YUD4_9FLAO|nr:MBL fold metallo-hydrolase [Aequorivita lipolytica]TXD70654.1 MBL fold metallo-hydrolase [Aequorivita lipolytica]SRX49689.1 Metallo-beta-lactamase type 2 [Aequorivita lipolytica]
MLSKLIFSAVFLFTVSIAFSQTDDGRKLSTKLIKVDNKIYMLQGKGGNIGLSFGNDGVFMIDDQFAEHIEQIQDDIKTISDKPVQFLVNTHFHGDHTGANAVMAQTGTIIFSQNNVRTRLEEMRESEKKKIPSEMLPMITFSEDMTFHYNGEKIYVFHVHNAHTDGDAMVYFTNSNVLHTGDVFFNGKYPFIDTENGGSVKGVIEGLSKAKLIINEDTKIIPGHGNVGSYSDLQKTIDMLSNTYKRVARSYINKNTEEEVMKMTDLTKAYDAEGYGDGFITTEAFIKMLYGEVAKERSSIDSNDEKNRKALEKIEQMKKERSEKQKN